MTIDSNVWLEMRDHRLTIASKQLAGLQQALIQAAKAGQSPYPLSYEDDLECMVRATWGLETILNRRTHAITELHVPSTTSMQTLDTFLSLIAPFTAIERPAYFHVVSQTEDGDRAFFYRIENQKVVKEERITTLLPVDLDLKFPRSSDDADSSQHEGKHGRRR